MSSDGLERKNRGQEWSRRRERRRRSKERERRQVQNGAEVLSERLQG